MRSATSFCVGRTACCWGTPSGCIPLLLRLSGGTAHPRLLSGDRVAVSLLAVFASLLAVFASLLAVFASLLAVIASLVAVIASLVAAAGVSRRRRRLRSVTGGASVASTPGLPAVSGTRPWRGRPAFGRGKSAGCPITLAATRCPPPLAVAVCPPPLAVVVCPTPLAAISGSILSASGHRNTTATMAAATAATAAHHGHNRRLCDVGTPFATVLDCRCFRGVASTPCAFPAVVVAVPTIVVESVVAAFPAVVDAAVTCSASIRAFILSANPAGRPGRASLRCCKARRRAASVWRQLSGVLCAVGFIVVAV